MLRTVCMETHPQWETWAAELQGVLMDSPLASWIPPQDLVGSQGPGSSVESPWHLTATSFSKPTSSQGCVTAASQLCHLR